MSRKIDMTGLTFGRLTVISPDKPSKRGLARWKCECSCGKVISAAGAELRNGNTKSCGCTRKTAGGEAAKGTAEYTAWESMIARCENKKHKAWHDYGGRGIKISPLWRHSFNTFLACVGRKPTPQHTLDRINNDGHYDPGNCRWATRQEQNANQRRRQNKNWRFAAKHAYSVVKSFEDVLASYCGSLYAVSCDSCTDAIMMAAAWQQRNVNYPLIFEVPKRTYCSVPMSIIRAGGRVQFREEQWLGSYQIKPFQIWDCARHLTSGMYLPGSFMCLSFHWSKHLPIGRGGAIICDDQKAAEWFRRMRFDGRKQGVEPKNDKGLLVGIHSYMTPDRAANGLMLMSSIKEHNQPLPNSDYPDLSTLDIFK